MALSRLATAARPRPRLESALPIVNIILMLIFFFMATGRFMAEPAPDVSPPLTQNLPPGELPSPLLVVRSDRTLELDGEPVTLEDLPAAVEGLGELNILIARSDPYGRLDEVLQRLEGAPVLLRVVTQDGTDAAAP